MTTSRMVVVLRAELGQQLEFANKRFFDAEENFEKNRYNTRARKKVDSERRSRQRLLDAINALGALTLGDIEEDKEF